MGRAHAADNNRPRGEKEEGKMVNMLLGLLGLLAVIFLAAGLAGLAGLALTMLGSGLRKLVLRAAGKRRE